MVRNIMIMVAAIFWSPTLFAGDVKLDVPYLQQAVPNIFTGGQPTLDDIKSLKNKGFEIVINLRGVGEFDEFDEQKEVEQEGLRYVSIPFKGMNGLTKANAKILHDVLKTADGKVLLHCTIGMRASGLLAVERYLYGGLSKTQAMNLAEKAHMSHVKDYVKKGLEAIDR